MKNQIHLSSRSEARRGNATSIICHRGSWRGLLLAGCCAVLAGLAPPAQAAVTEAWVHRYNGVVSNAIDQAVKVVRDAAGDIIVTGTTWDGTHGQDMLTIKYSRADGTVLWQQRYNGPANGDDYADALAVDSNGNVMVTGSSSRTNGYPDYYMAKYAASGGALLWERRVPRDYLGDRAQAVAVDNGGNVVVIGIGYYALAKYAAADGALLWEQPFNPWNRLAQAQAVAVDGSGNVVVTGYSDNGRYDEYSTVKYAAADGALLWWARYAGPGSSGDRAQAVALDSNGNVVVTGSSYGRANDYYTVKYAAADGALLWEKRYNGPANSDDKARAVAVDGSGNVVVTGSSHNGPPNDDTDYYTAKYAAADGALLWEQRRPANRYDYANALAVDGSGNVLVTGYSTNGTNDDYYTAKYAAADGALLWENRYNGPRNGEDRAQAVAVDGSGNVVVTGYSYNGWPDYGSDYYTANYSAEDGALLWEQRYNGLGTSVDMARAVAVDGGGNVVVTGISGGSFDDEGTLVHGDFYTAKYAAADGALLWGQTKGFAYAGDRAKAMALDGGGNVVVTGLAYDGTNIDQCTAKYAAANGALLWEKRSNGPAYVGTGSVAMDGNGNAVVTGSSYNGTNSDYYTAKYAAANGALLWEQRYNGPANSYDVAEAVAVDGSGNVVVTGSSYNTSTDYYTAKYAAADGALLWEQRYNGPANLIDYATAVAMDGSGNVVVTGYSWNGTNNDYYTAKYAAADGALLWEQRYNGPANNQDEARALAMDSSGNVVVTGYSNNGTNDDYYTAKYAAADGALLWKQRYIGPANREDRAQAVGVDGNGNVVVTGISDASRGWFEWWGGDYYTAKYAASDGALLWEKRYNGPANGDDSATSLALGPNGMVAITGTSSGDYATVVYWENLPPVSIALVPEGIRIRFPGIPGRSYTIQRAPAITGPWTPVNTQTSPASGLLEYLDAPPPPGSAFYRTVQP